MINEFRLFIAETFLRWAFDIAPEEKGKKVRIAVMDYFIKLNINKSK